MVERQAKAPLPNVAQLRQARCDLLHFGSRQRRHFQHDSLGCHQFQVTAHQAVVRAIDKQRLVANGRSRIKRAQHIEQQLRIACRTVGWGGLRAWLAAVEEFVTNHHAVAVHQCLVRKGKG